jgi:hypothetical protein
VAEHLAGAAVDDRNKHAPTVTPAVDEGEVGRPALVGLFGDGAGDLDAWAVSGAALGKCPTLELHDAVDFLDVNRDSLLMAKPGVNYRIACTSDLATWVELPNSRVTGAGIEVEYADPAVTAPGKFYRVEVVQP